MDPSAELPPELWMVILDFVIDDCIDPVQYCTYLTFPEISLHLRSPWELPTIANPSLQTLRLVCRTFKDLLHISPYFHMNSLSEAIPVTTRAFYVKSPLNTQLCLERLIAEPAKCRRIVLLNLIEAEPLFSPHAIYFDFLYDNAHLLPALRSLALRVRSSATGSVQIPQFWDRLNKSFPLLTSLVIRGGIYTARPSTLITFQRVELLDLDLVEPYGYLRFPALRCTSLTRISPLAFNRFASWSHLEALLLRSMQFGAQVPLNIMPRLRLLGLPQVNGSSPLAVNPLPRGHPLHHLHVYVGSRSRDGQSKNDWTYKKELIWLKKAMKQFPTLARIVLLHTEHNDNKLPVIQGDFRDEDLRPLNLVDEDSDDVRKDRTRITLRRVEVKGSGESPIGFALQRSSFRAGWNRLLGLDSRKPHL